MVEYINFHTVAAFLNALMLGAMSFFTLALAPVVFRALEREQAARLLSSLFPLYYRVLLVCATAAALLIFYRWESWVLWAVAALFLLADLVIRPRIEALRAARAAGDERARRRFGLLHGASFGINLVQLAAVVVVFFRLAA